jgi:hypothetical protein
MQHRRGLRTVVKLLGHHLVCALLLSALIIASIAMNSAADPQKAIKTTPVLPTDTCVDDANMGDTEMVGNLRGFRKRWSQKSGLSADEGSASCCSFAMRSQQETVEPCEKRQKQSFQDAVEILDKTFDDFAEVDTVGKPVVSGLSAHSERQAIVNTDMKVFKFPWERGRLAKIFGNSPAITVKTPQLKMGAQSLLRMGLTVTEEGKVEASPVLQPVGVADGRAVFLTVVKGIQDVAEPDNRAERRQKALHAWWSLLAHSLVSSAVGLKVSVEATMDTVLECAIEILDATFAVKSAGTLFRRLYAIQAYEDWCVAHLQKHWLPVSEFDVWTYVRQLQKDGAPATKPSSLVEALRFSWFLLGVEGADKAEASLRIKGVSSQMRASKRPWKPADLLTVLEVRTLHNLLLDETQPLGDRALAGHALHLLYARSRWSDLTMVNGVYMDPEGHFIEVATEMKTRLLPIVAPAVGVDGSAGAQVYLEVRRQCNLWLPLDGYGPMMCAPSNSTATAWTQRALTSEEGSEFLRKVLKAPKTKERRISTHSLKSTVMSWTSKYGLSEYSRAVLARHTSKASTATAVYSRDLLSPILRELNLVINAICNGSFCPDATRSGMLTPGALPYLGGTPLPFANVQAASTPFQPKKPGDDEIEVVETGSACSEWSLVQRNAEDMRLFGASEPASPSVVPDMEGQDALSETTEENSEQSTSDSEDDYHESEQHRDLEEVQPELVINGKSLVVHRVKSPGLLTCGRKLTPTYGPIHGLSGIRCSRCFDV